MTAGRGSRRSLVEGAAGDEDANHRLRPLVTRLTAIPTMTTATAPITLCQRNATLVYVAAQPTERHAGDQPDERAVRRRARDADRRE